MFSAWGYVEGSPSKITVSASCDCSLLYYTKERIESLLESSPELVAWERKALMRLLLSTDQSLADFSIPCATDRYEVLLRKMPELLQYVPLKDIAGFLGVTPQSLSRIRARIVK